MTNLHIVSASLPFAVTFRRHLLGQYCSTLPSDLVDDIQPWFLSVQPWLEAIPWLAFSLADKLLLPFVCCYYLLKESVQRMFERSIRMSSSACVNWGTGCGQELSKLWSATQPVMWDAHNGGGFSKKSLTWSVPGCAVSSGPSWGRRGTWTTWLLSSHP